MRRICVFCGSSLGADRRYAHAARDLGAAIAGCGLGLVYGGASVGLMGTLADAVLQQGGHVTGVIPSALVTKEIAHPALSDLRVVATMHERKALMADLADAFVALPGGIGTLEETFEVLTWAQLGLHRKPVGFLDTAGYYRPLLEFLDHAVVARFIKPEHRGLFIVDQDAPTLLQRLADHSPPAVEKWMAPDVSEPPRG
jgi:uncharacterized protein (TIGR00730 family)